MNDSSTAFFRTYGWTVPTLSLGYFQSIREAESDPRWRSVPIVRRPTGGGAIWHHHELTYCVALPKSHPLGGGSRDLYAAVHGALAELLRAHGVAASRRGGQSSHKIGESRGFLCFTDRDAEDIVAAGLKLVGSAQRRRSGAILQHGSMLLAGSDSTPELSGAREIASVSFDPRLWSLEVNEVVPRALGLEPEARPLPAAVRVRADELRRSVYRNDSWTRKR